MNKSKRREALFITRSQLGKIQRIPTKKYATQRVVWPILWCVEPCLEIAKMLIMYINIQLGNLVAVITNGTAVLGLEILVRKLKPVMEGSLLFKIFDIDVFDIEVDW
jgi:malic enzyme